MTKYQTREQWLLAAVELFRPMFAGAGAKIPEVRVSCGWPSTKALSKKQRRIGECWAPEASKDNKTAIFISPFISDPVAEQGVLEILAHELVHACVGIEAKHGKPFKKLSERIGLTGKVTAQVAGEDLLITFQEWGKELGDYPHASLDSTKRPTKKQTSRMVKCTCGKCGYTCRTTRKWLEEIGPPICSCNKEAMCFEIPEDLADEGVRPDEGDEA